MRLRRMCTHTYYSVDVVIIMSSPGDSEEHTSYRALRTENGLSKNPTPTRVVAPAIKLPVVERRGNVDECSEGEAVWTAAKYGEFAIANRTRESPVMYIAIPGTFRIRLAVDPRHKPKKPSEATIPLATCMTEVRFRILDAVSQLGVFPQLRSTLNGKNHLSEAES